MPLTAFLLSTISCLLLLGVPGRVNDLKIVTRQSFGAASRSYTTTDYFSGANSRREFHSTFGNLSGHLLAMIVQRGEDKNHVYTLDLQLHEYTSYETDAHGVTPATKGTPVTFSG